MILAGLIGLIFEGFLRGCGYPNACFSVLTHFSPDLCGGNWRVGQIPHSYEVVSGGRKVNTHPTLCTPRCLVLRSIPTVFS